MKLQNSFNIGISLVKGLLLSPDGKQQLQPGIPAQFIT